MRMRVIMSLFALLAALVLPAAAREQVPLASTDAPAVIDAGGSADETPQLWFVELTSPPAAEGTTMAALAKEKRAFRAAARSAGLQLKERYAFDVLWNGLSVAINPRDLAKLARVPGVAALYPVETITAPEPIAGASPELYTAIQMTGADIAHTEGYTGEGVKVAVVDTGIDYDHPDLGGCFGPACRVAYGYDLVGDDYNSSGSPDQQIPHPDEDPDDCAGHGTHVAGIVGANGAVIGVAPGVTFGAYRVFGCEGTTSADVMIAAMEMALADGMDVLNMSIGSAYQWPQYPTAAASDELVNQGVVVVASIGNNGTNGLYAAGAPGVGKKVIGTASVDNTHVALPYFEVNDRHVGYVSMTYAGPPPTSGTEEIVYVGDGCTATLPLLADPSGKVALITRGTCSFSEKAVNAINAGATAVVIHNNVSGVFNGTLGSPIDGTTPVVGISLEDGLFIRAQGAPVYMTWTDQMDSFPSPTGGLISSFSSYGLAPDLSLKPDITAPGGNIYSTYPLELGGYATLSGTSMASPHVAGAAALLLQAKPHTPSQVVRDILQNSSDPVVWWGNPGLGFLDNVHRQGAGLIDIDDAILATTKVTPGKIAAGEGEAGPYTQLVAVENKGDEAVTYDLSYVNALSTSGVITPGFSTSNAWVEFDTASLTVPPDFTASFRATIHPATGPAFGQYGGYVVLTPRDGGRVYRVPFAGFVGDYQGIVTLAPTSYGFPWLTVLYAGSYYKLEDPSDWTFTMEGSDIPFFLVHFDHQPEMFRMEIFSAKGKAWHRAYDERYLGRNGTDSSFYAFPFDGYTVNGKKVNTVPDGEYYAVISVLKANGDSNDPAAWESWTSPNFVIDRP